jgi:hypothetical protein
MVAPLRVQSPTRDGFCDRVDVAVVSHWDLQIYRHTLQAMIAEIISRHDGIDSVGAAITTMQAN